MARKRIQKQSQSRILLLSSLEPVPHQDAAELEPRQDAQRAASFFLLQPQQNVNILMRLRLQQEK
jgi:hypothetical protein